MSQNEIFELFATTPKGLELLLVDELRLLGAIQPAEKLAGVSFKGTLETAYKACLWSRLANRILFPLAKIPAATPEELYNGIQSIAWEAHLSSSQTLHIQFVSTQSKITHTLFGAQKVKDAIVDQLREKDGSRPTITADQPDISVHVYLHRDIATVSLDLSGESLHRRGYRQEQVAAPLKENLAAALLIRAGWKSGASHLLLDPMCGSGTLLIEGALIAGNIAPGLFRSYFGFLKWKKHDAALWATLSVAAEKIRQENFANLPTIIGYDHDPKAIKIAFANIERAGLLGKIHVEKRDLTTCTAKNSIGLLITNPPYGERLGEVQELKVLYRQLGEVLKRNFVGWQAAVFTSHIELGKSMGLRSYKQYAFYNGAIPSQLLLFEVQPNYFVDRTPETQNERRILRAQKILAPEELALAEMFANRLRKNNKKFSAWAKKENITSFRLYDADLPEYAVSIDQYGAYICVQEYPPPKTIDPEKSARRLQHIFAVIAGALAVSPKQIYFRNSEQLLENIDDLNLIEDNQIQFLINLTDLTREVGLSLEQRKLRQEIAAHVKGKNFLNLWSRSGAMSCIAAQANAATITSVCEDAFHLSWSQKNMQLNHFEGQCVQHEMMSWMKSHRFQYDVIFAELPASTFHLREQYPNFLEIILHLLSAEGVLYLVTKDSRLKLDNHLINRVIQNVSAKILPYDFERHANIQQCWIVSPQ